MSLSDPEIETVLRARPIEEDIERLRQYINNLEHEGTTRLPPEPKLGDKLGVSRSRLRTMLKRLEDERLIWRHVGRGTFIGARQLKIDAAAVAESISAHDFFEARLILEPALAAQAAIRATPADITTLDGCVEEMNSASSFIQWRRLDSKLHRTIAEATHNALLLILYDALRSEVRMGLEQRMEEVLGTPPQPEGSTHMEHHAIVDAIRSHNPALAAQVMREHIASIRESLFGSR